MPQVGEIQNMDPRFKSVPELMVKGNPKRESERVKNRIPKDVRLSEDPSPLPLC